MVRISIFKIAFILTLLLLVSAFLVLRTSWAEENNCVACHAQLNEPAKSVHAALKTGCETCHIRVEGKKHPDDKKSVGLIQKMPDLCFNCHKKSDFEGKSVHSLGGMCLSCHDPHRSNYPKLLRSESKDLCFTCHDKAKFTKKNVHSIIRTVGCTACHNAHASEFPYLLSESPYKICSSCHAKKEKETHVVALPGGKRHPIAGVTDPSTVKYIKVPDPVNPKKLVEVPDPEHPGKPMTCTSCHDPHSSDFDNLFVTERICEKCHQKF